jgi:hypothetical protein
MAYLAYGILESEDFVPVLDHKKIKTSVGPGQNDSDGGVSQPITVQANHRNKLLDDLASC